MLDLQKLVRPNILHLKPYSSARNEYKAKEGIFLDANENPYGTLNRYPDPLQLVLKDKLAELRETQEENIFIGNGSDEVIDLALRIFCEPGRDKALTFSPSYGMYEVSAAINNIELIKLPLNDQFQIDYNGLQSFLTDSSIKLIFICSPNNPTGNLMEIETIEKIANTFSGMIIIDEAYIEFAQAESMTSLIKKYDKIIISQTMSKAWGLAAARVGIAYANTQVINLFNRVKPPYNISQLNQEAAIEALDNFKLFSENKEEVLSERKRLIKELKKIETIIKIFPSEANFLLIQVSNANDMYQKLIELKIIVRNRNKLIKDCLRISIGTPTENNKLINALKKYK